MLALNRVTEAQVPDGYLTAFIEILKEEKCDELSMEETNEILDQLTAEVPDGLQIGKDTLKKMIDEMD